MDSRLALPQNTILDGSYRIERVVGVGGFGITYEAEDRQPRHHGRHQGILPLRLRRPRRHHERAAPIGKAHFEWGRSNFLQEARTLARFEHPNIVRVTRVFEANSTAYMVMRFEQGRNFEAWLTSLGRPPTQDELDAITAAVLRALETMHAANFLHRDIAPDNIIVRADGTPVLLDFGAARRAVAEASRASPASSSPATRRTSSIRPTAACRGRGPISMRWAVRCTGLSPAGRRRKPRCGSTWIACRRQRR